MTIITFNQPAVRRHYFKSRYVDGRTEELSRNNLFGHLFAKGSYANLKENDNDGGV